MSQSTEDAGQSASRESGNKISSEDKVLLPSVAASSDSVEAVQDEPRRDCPSCNLNLPFSIRVCPNDGTDLFLAERELFADKYELLEEIGQGAIGTIYKARHLALDSFVAIKVLNQVTEDRVTFLRFQREAKAASKIAHANVINVFDFGIWRDCQPYMVMDYLEGETLDKLLARKRYLSLTEIVDIAIPVAKALAHAHGSGILHRDLKPSNIMILKEGEAGARVKILDFGLAKLLYRDDGISLSATGAVLGSPAYMSPEQATACSVDARTDVYSLGCILYQLLTGEPPLMGSSAAETFMQRLNQDPAPASSLSDRYVPPRLDQMISRMIERVPGKRVKSATWILSELLAIKTELSDLTSSQNLPPVNFRDLSKARQQEKTVVDLKPIGIDSGERKQVLKDFLKETSDDIRRQIPKEIRKDPLLNPGVWIAHFKKQSEPIRYGLILVVVLILALVLRILIQ
ncbi:MAG: serine/threonine protein kinase [Candidatus Obscuribacterales bacterium]|nr:serine/threonine protein kinase [Candidatus Obscuribacterales bacterium]